jgi:hypothetical protein
MKLTNVSSRYGAPMGRPSTPGTVAAPGVKLHLNRIRLNQGGYDSGGAYWGIGPSLYHAWADAGEDNEALEHFFRASDREDAKAIALAKFPGATLYR